MSSSNSKKMVFMGSDAIALPTLEFLLGQNENVSIEAVYTQPDRARGRGKKVQANEIKSWALEHGLRVIQPDVFDGSTIQELVELNADIILVMAYGHILPQAVLDVPLLGIYNIHTSLLPELRGASPIETAVACGFERSGVSLMQLVMKMDAGPICDQMSIKIESDDTGGSYREKLAEASPRLLERNLDSMLEGSSAPKKQEAEVVTYCRLLVKQDGQLDFTQSAKELAHRINGLNPWPGCVADYGGVNLKIGLATFENAEETSAPGEILEANAVGVRVSTSSGVLNMLKLQRSGGKMLPAEAFLLGNPLPVGSRFNSHEMHPLISKKPVSHKRVFQLYTKP